MCTNPIYLQNKAMFVNCRKCSECKLARAKEWACRLHYELKNHDKACFITLTYDNAHSYHLLNKPDLQKFIKRFRTQISPKKIKYFACGEYGDKTFRPHFHAIIFGYDFPDKVARGKSKKGFTLYQSPELQKLWQYGFHTIQEVSLATCVYTALYTGKSKNQLPKNLQSAPEFNTMSQGLGVSAIISDYDLLKRTDQIWIDGQSYTIPQAVLSKLFITRDSDGCIVSKDDEYTQLKENRLNKHRERYPKHAELLDDFINSQEAEQNAVDRIKALNRQIKAEKAYYKPFEEKAYSAEKKYLTKTL